MTELKSFGSPPAAVVNVTAAVMVLLSNKQAKVPKDRSWKAAKVMMGKVGAEFFSPQVPFYSIHCVDRIYRDTPSARIYRLIHLYGNSRLTAASSREKDPPSHSRLHTAVSRGILYTSVPLCSSNKDKTCSATCCKTVIFTSSSGSHICLYGSREDIQVRKMH